MRRGVLGEIVWFGGGFAPLNWMFCQGQRLSAAKFAPLASALARPFVSEPATLTLPAIADQHGAHAIICVGGSALVQDAVFPIDCMMGEIRGLACAAAPRGWEVCDGHSIDLRQNVALYSIIETRFGADGGRYRMPALAPLAEGVRSAICNYGMYPDYDSDRRTQDSQAVGEIRLWSGTRVPSGWWPCDGRLVEIPRNTTVFAILGDTFGGDLRTAFALPKMSAPIAGTQFIISHSGIFPSRG